MGCVGVEYKAYVSYVKAKPERISRNEYAALYTLVFDNLFLLCLTLDLAIIRYIVKV